MEVSEWLFSEQQTPLSTPVMPTTWPASFCMKQKTKDLQFCWTFLLNSPALFHERDRRSSSLNLCSKPPWMCSYIKSNKAFGFEEFVLKSNQWPDRCV